MVKLPSGRSVGLYTGHILEPDMHWFACPGGHFWHQSPDLAINSPPFQADQDVICDFVHDPCPTTPDEAAQFVRIIEFYSDKNYYWPGMTLAGFRRSADWTDEDWEAWQEWRASAAVSDFLKRVIRICREQADANQSRSGPPTFRGGTSTQSESMEAATARAVAIVREAVQLDSAADAARSRRDESEGLRVFTRLTELHQEVEAMLFDSTRCCAEGWHAKGILCRLLRRPEEAERAFVEVTRMAPFALDAWLELTRIRAEAGKTDAAVLAARRAVTIRKDSAAAWTNLGSALMQASHLEEARQAVDRALELDPDDIVARNVVKLIQRRAGD